MPAASIELSEISNLTADLELFKGTGLDFLEVAEYGTTSIGFRLPVKKVAVGHHLSFAGKARLKGLTVEFTATGKVQSVQEGEDLNSSRVFVQLHQFNKDIWEKFLSSMADDQKRVDELLQSLKGDGI